MGTSQRGIYIGTGYDYPDLPGLGSNNEKLGLPERLKYRNTIPLQEHISQKKIGSSYLLELPGLIITRNSCM